MEMTKKRTLCLDVGDKKIGVAVSDPFGKTAQPLTILQRQNFQKDCLAIAALLKEYEVKKMVIGLPLDLNSREGPQAKKVRFFKETLENFLHQTGHEMEIELWDESFSSAEAEEILLEADLSRKKRKKVIDKLAAALILQSWLEREGHD